MRVSKKVHRGGEDSEEGESLNILQPGFWVNQYKFNHRCMFDVQATDGEVFNIIDSYRAEVNPESLTIKSDSKKKFILLEDKASGVTAKVKLWRKHDNDANGEEDAEGDVEELIVVFQRKKGGLEEFNELMEGIGAYMIDIVVQF